MKNSKMLLGTPIAMCVLALLSGAASAKAGCGDPMQSSGGAVVVPFLEQPTGAGASLNANDTPQSTDRHARSSIVGLWHVTFVMSNGATFYESFDLWHSDGTEIESANGSPLGGNVCVGVWRETQAGAIQLHHVGWTFENGTLIGSFTLDETNTLAPGGNTYQGPFLFESYDLNGILIQQIKGTLTARRITVNTKRQD